MKHLLRICMLMLTFSTLSAQDSVRVLPSFNKIVVSPRISLILIKGDKESIRLVCNNINPKKVNVRVHGKKLRVFLDHARIAEKQVRYANDFERGKHGIYDGVSITAYVTYKDIKALEIRGESELSSADPIETHKLKLRVYGECDVDLASITADKFKASLYGESKMRVRGGEVNRQVYRIFGETRIDSKGLVCATASIRMYGEGKVKLNATDEIHVTAIGETRFDVLGDAIISRGIVIGRADINKL